MTIGEGGIDYLMKKHTPELPRGNLSAVPVEMTGLKSVEDFSDTGLVVEEVANQSDIVHGYTARERKMGQGYGEGYDGGGVYRSSKIPYNFSNMSNDSEFEDPMEFNERDLPYMNLPAKFKRGLGGDKKKQSNKRKKPTAGSFGKKKSKAKTKGKSKAKTKAKRDLMKAKKTLKRALARYNKVMKM